MSTIRVGAVSCRIGDNLARAVQRLENTRAFSAMMDRMKAEAATVGREAAQIWPVRQRMNANEEWRPTDGAHSRDLFGAEPGREGTRVMVTLRNRSSYAYYVRSRLLGYSLTEQRMMLASARDEYKAWRNEARRRGDPVRNIGVGVRSFLPGKVKSGSAWIHARAKQTSEKMAREVVELLAKAAEEAIRG